MSPQLQEKTKVAIPLGVIAAGVMAWMTYMTVLVFQVKEDVAVIKASIAPIVKTADAR